ncbi:MAG: hypothetical protein ACK2UC_07395 [Anaerolineae bacterium]
MTKSGPERATGWLTKHWLLAVNLAMGLFIGGTLLPPVLMQLGWEGPGRIFYALYGLNCHQLPERSYFLFGPDGINTYSMDRVLSWGADPDNLRRFVGNPQVGFKLGMAQRNTAIYSTFLLAGLTYGLVRSRFSGLRWPVFLLLALPMVLDGGSHMVSEVTGLGFRAPNSWLAVLTGQALPQTFYAGTTAGSLNWLMRTLTGVLFAIGCVGFGYPYLQRGFAESTHRTPERRAAAGPAQEPRAAP